MEVYDASPEMPEIFEETQLSGIQLANRLVRSATWEGLAGADGRITPALIDIHQELFRT